LLEAESGGSMLPAEQMHPGFATLDEALALVDFDTATREDLLERYRIVSELIRADGGGREEWIFPPSFTHKFSGKKITVAPGERFETVDAGACGLFVWRGQGRLNTIQLSAETADEFFVGAAVATQVHILESTGDQPLEVFKVFPWGVYGEPG
jgi:hypothetical protein